MARTKKALPENERCRGRWSKCGGVNPAKSASWHLCAGPGSCTEKYRAMKKAEAATRPKAAKKDAAPRSAGSSPTTAGLTKPRVPKNSGGQVRAKTPPAPPKVPVARVNVPTNFAPAVQLVAPSAS